MPTHLAPLYAINPPKFTIMLTLMALKQVSRHALNCFIHVEPSGKWLLCHNLLGGSEDAVFVLQATLACLPRLAAEIAELGAAATSSEWVSKRER